MKIFPPDPELLAVAGYVVWFRAPADPLADPYHFLAHVMTFASVEDLKALAPKMQLSDWADALQHATPVIFDAISWAYKPGGFDWRLPEPY